MSMAVHQTARFCNNPMLSHKKTCNRLSQYLYHTNKKGIIYNLDTSKFLECYVDTGFLGGCQEAYDNDADNVISRYGMFIMYANSPIFWRRSLQTEIALSTAEEEYIEFYSALRQVLPLMKMLEEINEVFSLLISKPNFVCREFTKTINHVSKWLLGKFSLPEPNTLH